MPFSVADFFVKFLTTPGDLVADPFFGYGTTGDAAESNGCRWIGSELHHEYLYAGSYRFETCDGFERNISL